VEADGGTWPWEIPQTFWIQNIAGPDKVVISTTTPLKSLIGRTSKEQRGYWKSYEAVGRAILNLGTLQAPDTDSVAKTEIDNRFQKKLDI